MNATTGLHTEIRRLECLGCLGTFEAEVVLLGTQKLIRQLACPSCVKRNEAEEAEREATERARAVAARLAVIPERFAGARADHEGVWRWTAGFLAGARHWLLLQGEVGRGKTHQAWGAWREIAEARPETTLVAWTVDDLLDELRAGGERALTELRRCQRANLLLLDDLGVSQPTEFAARKLQQILDDRWRNDRPVIITTNVAADQLESDQVLTERLGSRIADVVRVVTIKGPDRRRAR